MTTPKDGVSGTSAIDAMERAMLERDARNGNAAAQAELARRDGVPAADELQPERSGRWLPGPVGELMELIVTVPPRGAWAERQRHLDLIQQKLVTLHAGVGEVPRG